MTEVIPFPSGPFILIDGGNLPESFLRTLPDILAEDLAAVGVLGAVVASPRGGGPLDGFREVPSAVSLVVLPPPGDVPWPPPTLPSHWLEVALSWLDPSEQETIRVAAVLQSVIDLSTLPQLLAAMANAQESVRIVQGDLDRLVHAVAINHLPYPYIVLAAGGPEMEPVQTAKLAEELREVARRLASEAGYAFITIESDFRLFGSGEHALWRADPDDWKNRASFEAIDDINDTVLLDAFWYQLLGARHVQRLGGVPKEGIPLARGIVEVTFDPLEAWAPDHPEHLRILRDARAKLAPCLIAKAEAQRVRAERYGLS
ncbi:MAG TPA: hypothetical protein VG034_10250 [Acidimicrobiia bacterium]|nr:hypothetical protein [Acidimicrobiia bacterium]